MKKQIILTLFMSLFVLFGSAQSVFAMANPASVKCITDGGTSSIQTNSRGEYGNCTFPDGSVCEEWAYYNGTCTPNKVNSISELPSTCVAAFDGCNSCSKTSNGQWACTKMACMNEPIQPAAYCKKFVTTTPDPVMCPAIYAPVCGQKQVQCIKAPCYPEQQTYGNSCEMGAAGATLVHDGICESTIHQPSFCNASYIKLVRGSKGDYVRELQTYLRDQGYNPGSIDGIFGRQVAAAVKLFQKNFGLSQDSVFGKNSRARACSSNNNSSQNVLYNAVITQSTGPQIIGGSAQVKNITVTVSGLSQPKTATLFFQYDSYAIVPNPIHNIGTREVVTILQNGINTISNIILGPVISMTVDGVSVPFQEK